MDTDISSPLKPRPHLLRHRSHSLATKPIPDDSDTSRRSSFQLRHRQTLSHSHSHSHPHSHSHSHSNAHGNSGRHHQLKRAARDRLGLDGASAGLPEVRRGDSRISSGETGVSSTSASATASTPAAAAAAAAGRASPAGKSAEEAQRLVSSGLRLAGKRESELRDAVQRLSEAGMRATRDLDEMHYSLLERGAGLLGAVRSLEELCGETGRLRKRFWEEAGELEGEVRRQMDALNAFAEQRGKIEVLVERMEMSRVRARGLSERLDSARGRIGELEEREREYQDSISWRLKWMWTVLAMLAGIAFAALVVSGQEPGKVTTWALGVEDMLARSMKLFAEILGQVGGGEAAGPVGIGRVDRAASSGDDLAFERILNEL